MDSDPEIRAISEAIVSYVGRWPEAADTVDGIARWWLGADFPSVSPERVEQAVEGLCEQGSMEGAEVSGRRVYRAAPDAEPRADG